MKALVYNKNSDPKITLENRPMPEITLENEAIIKVTLSSICTSDLHITEGFVPKAKNNIILGHEFVGVVEKTGKNVKNYKKGDRVSVNCETFCGKCFFCQKKRKKAHHHLKTSCNCAKMIAINLREKNDLWERISLLLHNRCLYCSF